MWQMHGLDKRKIAYSESGSETKIDFALVGESNKVLGRCENNSLGIAI